MTQYGPPPQLGYASGGWGQRRASGLGVAALILGIIALVAAMVPCCGMIVAIPLGIVGAILGLVGFIAAGPGGQTPRGMPLAGLIVSLVALAITFAWPFIFAAITPPTAPAPPGSATQPVTQPATTGPGDAGDTSDPTADEPPAGGSTTRRSR